MRPKILLVDDNDAVLCMMQESLEAQNFEVVPAANVTEALSQIVTQHFDVLITDLHMPGPGDGFTVATAMRHSQPDALTLAGCGKTRFEADAVPRNSLVSTTQPDKKKVCGDKTSSSWMCSAT